MVDNHQYSTAAGSYRRDVMKLLGAGTAAAAFGGVAAADEHEEVPVNDDDEYEEPDGIDTDVDAELGTVHVVRTLIRESTAPGRPADFFYEPTGIHIEPGDVIRFLFETPDHNVTSYHPAYGMERRVPAGVQPFSSPILGWDPRSLPDDIDMPPSEHGGNNESGESNENGEEMDGSDGPVPMSWLHLFEEPGVYDLECAPHEAYGMAMRVVVGEETETTFETSDPDELLPPRAGPVGFSRQVLTDPNLEPESVVESGTVEWMDLEMNQQPENGAENGEENDVENGANGETDENGEAIDENDEIIDESGDE